MSLSPGTRLGPYEVQGPLGAGGMGEVYRARDVRLDRNVAVKVLASHLSSSPELKQRMEREARAISSLNHSNICHLYDIGSQNGTDFLVMELLQGETLAQRLAKGPLPIGEILKIGIQVADALAVAHRQGIVHRDLKPGNIMLTPTGAKLMDFGLAKPIGGAGTAASASVPSFTAAPTLSGPRPLSPLTAAGTMVGTFQYMSPEQIEGKEADARSDIFAFGAVLYEMATGKRAFDGKSQLSMASAILEKDPEPMSVTKPLTPPSLERLVDTCLRKNPDERVQTAHDIKLQLQWIAEERPVSTPAAQGRAASRVGPWIIGIVLALLLGGAVGYFTHRPASMESLRTSIVPPPNTNLQLGGDQAGPPVLSPDGSQVAFTAAGSDGKVLIWVRAMNSTEARALPDTVNATFPFWSPDGRSLGYFADSKLRTIDVESGSSQAICDSQVGRGGTWAPDGTIIFAPGVQQPLSRIPASGGQPVQITKLDSALHTSHRWPFMLPDGKHFLYVAIHHDSAKSAEDAVYWASLDGRDNHMLFHSLADATYANGYLLFARGDQLMAQRFNPDKGELSGEAQTVIKGVLNDLSTWRVSASAARNGLLVYASGAAGDVQVVWVDRTGKQVGTVADHVSGLQLARLSPQGDRVALQIDAGMNDIWTMDLARGVRTRITFGPVANVSPVWSPDGTWIAYVSRRENNKFRIYRKRSDGSGNEEVLTEIADATTGVANTQWSPDGRYVLFAKNAGSGQPEIWALPLEGDRKPFQVIPRGQGAQLSPDGHWLAYNSSESGTAEVYVVPFGGGQGKWQVTADGGSRPRWSNDGKQIYFMDRRLAVFSVAVSAAGGALNFGTPQSLATNNFASLPFYDVAPDNNKILIDRVAQQINQSITVVTNFTSTLNK